MKRKLIFLAITCILVTLCCSCRQPLSDPANPADSDINVTSDLIETTCQPLSDPADFDFVMTCEIEQGTVARGDRIRVATSIQNNSDKAYVYQNNYDSFNPVPSLYTVCKDGTRYSVPIESYPITDDAQTNIWTVDAGERWNAWYYFTIPADAPAGSYSIDLANNTHSQTFENVFVLDDIPAE